MSKKSNILCVNSDEETLKILSDVKNKSEFIREAIKEKFQYEFKEEYTKLKTEFEKIKLENEKLKAEIKSYEEKIKENEKKVKINDGSERFKEENKTLHEGQEKTDLSKKNSDTEKEKSVQIEKIYRAKPEADIIKEAREIYNKYKKYGKSAIKITEKYLQKRGIADTGKIIEEVIKNDELNKGV